MPQDEALSSIFSTFSPVATGDKGIHRSFDIIYAKLELRI